MEANTRTIRISPEVHAHLLEIKNEAEALFGRRYTWDETVKLALQAAKFPKP